MSNESNLDVNIRGNDGLTPALNQIESKLIRFVGAVSSALTAIKVVGFPVQAVRQFEAQMANVQKTTNFTDLQIKSLSASIVDMSRNINVSANDLGAIAAAAGQQGLGREGVDGVKQFTETVSRMAAVLDLTAEDAGKNVGKIASVFKVSLRDIESVSSAINQVSNNSTATGAELLDVVKRIGNAAGALNLQQSIGLAATGLDLGQSPEVVGSSYAKIFAEMFARADKFSKLLGISTKDWMNILQKDGIEALKMYYAGLRKLSAEDQQKTIKALSGGGRIGVVVTKGVQDTDNTILDRNLRNAQEGKDTGTSALKEQLTVLKTLDAEIDKLYNSFQALGIKSGEVFGPKLAGYFAQLNAALANPAVINFAENVGKAFLSLFDAIATGIKWLASLNVNWENFITVAKVMLGLKLAQFFLAQLGAVPLLGTALSAMGLQAIKAGEQQAQGSAAANTAVQNQIAKIKELMAQRAAASAAVKAQTEAEIAQSKALAAQKLAETQNLKAANLLKSANTNVAAAGAGVTAAKGGVAAAQASAAAQVANVQATMNARIATQESAHQARLTAIVAEGDRARNLARTLGDTNSVKLANQLQAQAIAQEESFQARSLTGINSYYARRILIAREAGVAEVGAAQLGLMQSFSRFDQVSQGKGFNVLTVNARNAAIALTQADAAVVATTASLAAANGAVVRSALGWGSLRNAVQLAGTAFQFVMTIAARVFFWATIIYTVLDAFHLLDGIGETVQKFTDKLGLTSEASRQVAQAERDRAAATDEANAKMREAIQVMDKFIDKRTGLLDKSFDTQIRIGLGDQDPNVQAKALNELVSVIEGAYAELEQAKKTTANLPGLADSTKADMDAVVAEIAAAQQKITDLQTKQRTGAGSRFGGVAELPEIASTTQHVKDLQQVLATLQAKVATIGPDASAAVDKTIANTKTNLQQLTALTSSVFTDESAKAYVEFAPKYIAAVQQQAAAKKALDEANTAYNKANGDADAEAKRQAVQNAIDSQTAANAVRASVEQDLGAYIAKMKEQGNLTDAMIGSLDRLPAFFNNSIPQLQAVLRIVQGIFAAGAGGFKGDLAPTAPTAPTGDGKFNPGGNEKAEARALSKARVELARAELQAIANLEKQGVTEQTAALEYGYGKGLETIKNYYAKRLQYAQENLDIETRLKQNEIAALNTELGEAEEQSSKVRVQGQIVKAEGELKVLAAQRKAAVDTNTREQADALRDFSDKLINQQKSLVEYFGSANDTEAFQASLDSSQAAYRDFVAKLRTESANQPELLKLVDRIEMQAQFEAVEAGLQRIAREATLTSGQFDLVNARISMLKDNGTITGVQASGAYAEVRKAVIAVKEAELSRSEDQLAQLFDASKAIDDQSLKYKELALTVAGSKQSLEVLKTQANDTAKDINTSINGAFKSLFQSLANPDASLMDAIREFGLKILSSITDVAAGGLADTITKAMGGMSGGIGGMFSSLFGGDGGLTDTKGTEINPMITKEWSAGTALGLGGPKLAGVAGDASKDAPEGIISQGLDMVTNGVSNLGTMLMGGLSSVTAGVGTAFSSGLSGLMGFIGPLFSSLIAAIFASGASSGASSGFGAVAGAALAAHNGGIAGHLTMRKSGIGVMAPAVAYHTGGIVGLQPDEVSAVLKKGEEVMTKEDPRHRDNLGKDPEQAGGPQSIRIVPVLDGSVVTDAMSSSQGEQVIMAVIKKNPSAVRQMLNIKS